MELHQSTRTDMFKNGISQLESLKAAMVDDLNFYIQRPNTSAAYIDIKQKQIGTLDAIIQMFTHVYNSLECDFLQQSIKLSTLSDKIFAAEAAAFYYGVSPAEITHFTNRPIDQVSNDLQRCINEKWRQVPLGFLPFIDMSKSQKAYEEVHVNVLSNGQTTYTTKAIEVKTSNAPIYNWSQFNH